MEWAWLIAAAASAGFIDAVVGGGGLVLLPALFSGLPNVLPTTLLGTNKLAAVWGTGLAAWRYARHVRLNWSSLWPALLAAFVGSFCGAWLVTLVPPDSVRLVLPWVMLVVLLYTLVHKNLGKLHTPRFQPRWEILVASLIGFFVGAYDGFFGPGTGSFFIFALVRLLGYDFLHASASSKLLNTATNIAAIILFSSKGFIWWELALVLGLASIIGSLLGTHFAMKHGSGFVRVFFLLVVSALLLKTGYDAYWV